MCFSEWSKQVYYVLTVEFNCNSMSTIIVLIVFIKFEELTGKKLLVLKQQMMIIKITLFFGIGNNKLYSCIKNIVPIGR